MFADRGASNDLLPLMATAGFAGAMLDTAGKRTGSLLDHTDITALQAFVAACRRHELATGLAGALEAPDIPRLLLLQPDFVGFRRALCVKRNGDWVLHPPAMQLIRELIPRDEKTPAGDVTGEANVDYRLLAARGHSDQRHASFSDRVFVRDFVVPASIGAYAREHEKSQRLRFNVEVTVARATQPAADMRDVFSYDVITDGIRMILGQEHIALVETVAERIAALLLADARVKDVMVRVEKLDVGSGSVGVEIRRGRAAEAADAAPIRPAGEKSARKQPNE
jgi:dihydroneopterin aldolase